jgi:hypothetical protein
MMSNIIRNIPIGIIAIAGNAKYPPDKSIPVNAPAKMAIPPTIKKTPTTNRSNAGYWLP